MIDCLEIKDLDVQKATVECSNRKGGKSDKWVRLARQGKIRRGYPPEFECK